jgi:hypothetical protein
MALIISQFRASFIVELNYRIVRPEGICLFIDPNNRFDRSHYNHKKIKAISSEEQFNQKNVVEITLAPAGIDLRELNASGFFITDYKKFQIVPENFKSIVLQGGLRRYEFHSSMVISFMKILTTNNIFLSTIYDDLLN